MGLFDSIKKKVGDAANDYKDAYTWAQDKDVRTICEAMKDAEGMKLNGYSMVLHEKCQDMKTAELKELYYAVRVKRQSVSRIGIGNFAITTSNQSKAAETIGSILVDRGVFARNEDGTIND